MAIGSSTHRQTQENRESVSTAGERSSAAKGKLGVDAPASVPLQKNERVEKGKELLWMIAFVHTDSILVSFGPPGGSEEAQAPNPSTDVVLLDVVPLDTQSGERGEPTVRPSGAGDLPLLIGAALQVLSRPSEQTPVYHGQPCRGHFRKSSPIIRSLGMD